MTADARPFLASETIGGIPRRIFCKPPLNALECGSGWRNGAGAVRLLSGRQCRCVVALRGEPRVDHRSAHAVRAGSR